MSGDVVEGSESLSCLTRWLRFCDDIINNMAFLLDLHSLAFTILLDY